MSNIHPEAKWCLWVVAFNKQGYRAETPVNANGTFHFHALPPGTYGLKIGHDGIRDNDAEVPFPEKPDKQNIEEYKES